MANYIILLESGNRTLLEDGNYLLLEQPFLQLIPYVQAAPRLSTQPLQTSFVYTAFVVTPAPVTPTYVPAITSAKNLPQPIPPAFIFTSPSQALPSFVPFISPPQLPLSLLQRSFILPSTFTPLPLASFISAKNIPTLLSTSTIYLGLQVTISPVTFTPVPILIKLRLLPTPKTLFSSIFWPYGPPINPPANPPGQPLPPEFLIYQDFPETLTGSEDAVILTTDFPESISGGDSMGIRYSE